MLCTKDSNPTSQPSSLFEPLSTVTELPGLRTFDWYPHSQQNIVAAGISTGKCLLVRLGSSNQSSSRDVVQINGNAQRLSPTIRRENRTDSECIWSPVRHSRPITVTSFSSCQPGLLAVGLEKGRGESLLVYDINATARAFEGGGAGGATPSISPNQSRGFSLHRETSQTGHSRGRANSPASQHFDPHPLLSFGSSEVINSANFLSTVPPNGGASPSSTSPLLAATMANKWLRIYDLRSPAQSHPATTVASWSTRSVYGISPNPFNSQQFLTHGGDHDGVVKMWDLRKPMDPLLSFSEADAGAVPAYSTRRSPSAVKPLAEINWCSQRRGVVGTLEKDSSTVRVWNLVDGPGPRLVGEHQQAQGEMEASLSEMTMDGRRPNWERNDERESYMRMPIVLEDRRCKLVLALPHVSLMLISMVLILTAQAFNQPLSSFAFAPTPNPSSPIRIVGLSRDSSGPGSTGHKLEMISFPLPPHFDFLERGLLSSSCNSLSHFQQYHISTDSNENDHTDDEDLAITSTPHLTLNGSPPPSPRSLPRNDNSRGRGLTLSTQALGQQIDRNATPRPTSQLQRLPSTDLPGDLDGGDTDNNALAEDMSVLLRQRVLSGYGADAHKNVGLCEASLAEFWRWIGREFTW